MGAKSHCIDLFVVDLMVGPYSLNRLGLQNEVTYYDAVLFAKGYPMPFAKKSSYPNIVTLCEKFSEELSEMKCNSEYGKILHKWLK